MEPARTILPFLFFCCSLHAVGALTCLNDGDENCVAQQALTQDVLPVEGTAIELLQKKISPEESDKAKHADHGGKMPSAKAVSRADTEQVPAPRDALEARTPQSLQEAPNEARGGKRSSVHAASAPSEHAPIQKSQAETSQAATDTSAGKEPPALAAVKASSKRMEVKHTVEHKVEPMPMPGAPLQEKGHFQAYMTVFFACITIGFLCLYEPWISDTWKQEKSDP